LDGILASGQVCGCVASLLLADDHEGKPAILVLEFDKSAGERLAGGTLY
jgi:hypothetical protein